MTMKPLITPTVNLNGTDGRELVKQRLRVITEIDGLIDTLHAYLPHGRDYQHLIRADDWALHRTTVKDAREAWEQYVELLLNMRDAFHADAIAIDKQVGDRRRA